MIAPKNHRSRAFTLVEMLMSIGITALMLLAIHQIFKITTDTVSIGVATTELISNVRSLDDQIQRDVERMVRPNDGGFLGFLCSAIDGVINFPFIGDLILDALQGLADVD